MIIVPVKEGENIEKALKKFKRKFDLCTEAPQDGTRCLRTEAARYRRVKKERRLFGSFSFFS